tara:strand:- start:12 stop:473 length:462 start_codon:yes stop_codon:yes gene_type:complete
MAVINNKKQLLLQKYTPIGWREWIYLPLYKNYPIKAKIDTGARSSALHANSITEYKKDGRSWISFKLEQNNQSLNIKTKLIKHVKITNSFGNEEIRPVINLKIKLGIKVWYTDITLAKRTKMTYPMLIGRNTLKKNYIIHSNKSYLTGPNQII